MSFQFPEPLFESTYVPKPKLCLVCGKKKADSVLRTVERDVCPICKDCSARWNTYSYSVLKGIKPLELLKNIYFYKLLHWFEPSLITIFKDMKSFRRWGNHMKQFKHLL